MTLNEIFNPTKEKAGKRKPAKPAPNKKEKPEDEQTGAD